MKKVICFIAASTFLVNVNAQHTQRTNFADFTGIDVSSAARATLIQSDSNYVILSSKDSIKKLPSIQIRKGILEISSPFRGTVEVHVKHITSIIAEDAGRVDCKDTLKTDNLYVHVSDVGHAELLVNAKNINAHANDAGYILLSGSSDSLEVKVSDASRINAENLKANAVKAHSTDGSNATVWAVKSIIARASDGSAVHVKGNPANRITSARDGSSIKMDDSGDVIVPGNESSADSHYEWKEDSTKIHNRFKIDADGFIGMGFITGGYNGAEVKYGTSREFMIGAGKDFKIIKWNAVGFDIYYKSTDFYLAQNSGKSFPDSLNHKAQKISFQNFGGLVYDRFYFGRHIFLDGGFYGDWTFHSKLITWDDNITNVSSSKTVLRNLSFVNSDNYGLTFRFGSTQGLSVYFNYRLSQYFKNPSAPEPAYPQLPVYVMGVNLGGF